VTGREIAIRQTDDLDAVRRLGVLCGLEDSGRDEEDVLAAWGAFAGDDLVGAIVLERRDEMDTVNWMSVDDSYRRRGVASRLYAALEADALRRGMRRLWVTARAPAFFVSQGFSVAPPGGRRDALLGECPLCEQYERTCTPQALTKRIDDSGPGEGP
jgi:N-acetylglutamate synthase-like GNAT family acetyltransferase